MVTAALYGVACHEPPDAPVEDGATTEETSATTTPAPTPTTPTPDASEDTGGDAESASASASTTSSGPDDDPSTSTANDTGDDGASTNPDGAPVGSPCDAHNDCLRDGHCIDELPDGQVWPSGYCTIFGCTPGDASTCPDATQCITLGPRDTACLRSCFPPDLGQGDCDDGYSCQLINEAHATGDGVCVPPCTEGSCPPGLACNQGNGVCETMLCDAPGTPGTCGDDAMCCGLPPPMEEFAFCQPDCSLPAYAAICPSFLGPGAYCDGGCCVL